MLTFHQILIRLLVSAGLGAAIGVERDYHRRPAGIRTSMFVCMATCLFTILSVEIARATGDPSTTRISSNIVQGIGFLGAGAILKDSAGLVGMTTAATIFVEAAIGMAAGGGMFQVAAATTAIVLFGLLVVAFLAERINLKPRVMLFRFTASQASSVAKEVQQLFVAMNVSPTQFRVSVVGTDSLVEVEADVKHREQEQIISQMHREGVTTEVISIEGRHG
jgi:putative Mg2+ transporter-C (MgtC) family protein